MSPFISSKWCFTSLTRAPQTEWYDQSLSQLRRVYPRLTPARRAPIYIPTEYHEGKEETN